MAKYIRVQELLKRKFHDLPYTHITPPGLDAKAYEIGWNDAIDAIVYDLLLDDEPFPDVRENVHATWQRAIVERGAVRVYEGKWECSNCGYGEDVPTVMGKPTIWHFCPNCGAQMDERREDAEIHS